MHPHRRSVNIALLAALAISLRVAATRLRAEECPLRLIALIVPIIAGGITDSTARLVARKFGEQLKQPVFADNRPGADVGAEIAAKAKPNGYTLFLGTKGTHAANQYLYKSIAFDPLRDLLSHAVRW